VPGPCAADYAAGAAPQAGTTDVLVEHLPGVPDGICRASAGGFWVSLVVPIKPIARLLRSRLLRAVLAWMPQGLRPPPGRCAQPVCWLP
jgi:sugar lactone lactonase YvrE